MIEVVVVATHVAKNGVLTSPSLFDILYTSITEKMWFHSEETPPRYLTAVIQ